jgi:hypothetical protein
MADFATEFVELSKIELAAFAASRARALHVALAPERLDEVIETLISLQAHARAFLADL